MQTGCSVGESFAQSVTDLLKATEDIDNFPLDNKRQAERISRLKGVLAETVSMFLPTDEERALNLNGHDRLSKLVDEAHVFDKMGSLLPGYLDRIYSKASSQQTKASAAACLSLPVRSSLRQ